MIETLHQYCPNHLKPQGTPVLELIYRGTRDGFTAAEFHRLCDGKPNTFTIVRDPTGSIFGGFADIPWSSTRKFEPSRASFLFTLSLHGARNPLAARQCNVIRNPTQALFHHDAHLAVFGGGHDLLIAEGCNTHHNSTVCLGHTYQDHGFPHLFTGGAAHFRVDELEVFAVIGPAAGPVALAGGQQLSLSRAFEANFEKLGLGERYAPLVAQARALDDHAHALLAQGLHLHELQAEVDRDEEDLANEIDFMQRIYPTAAARGHPNGAQPTAASGAGPVLCFNAGGAVMSVSRGTLSGAPESMLCTQYCSDRWAPPQPRDLDADGAVFLDVNPYCFARIISRLRFAALADARTEVLGNRPVAAIGIDAILAAVMADPGPHTSSRIQGALPEDTAAAVAEAEAAGARRLFFLTLDPTHRASFDRMLGYFQLQGSILFRCLDTNIEEVSANCKS